MHVKWYGLVSTGPSLRDGPGWAPASENLHQLLSFSAGTAVGIKRQKTDSSTVSHEHYKRGCQQCVCMGSGGWPKQRRSLTRGSKACWVIKRRVDEGAFCGLGFWNKTTLFLRDKAIVVWGYRRGRLRLCVLCVWLTWKIVFNNISDCKLSSLLKPSAALLLINLSRNAVTETRVL